MLSSQYIVITSPFFEGLFFCPFVKLIQKQAAGAIDSILGLRILKILIFIQNLSLPEKLKWSFKGQKINKVDLWIEFLFFKKDLGSDSGGVSQETRPSASVPWLAIFRSIHHPFSSKWTFCWGLCLPQARLLLKWHHLVWDWKKLALYSWPANWPCTPPRAQESRLICISTKWFSKTWMVGCPSFAYLFQMLISIRASSPFSIF